MFVAAFFDFFDGLIARLLKVTSPIGRDLDSLSDVVTFGVLPGLMMFMLIKVALVNTYMDVLYSNINEEIMLLTLPCIFIPVFSAIRLARFNNDPAQSYSFKGLPTPANGLVIASLFFWIVNQLQLQNRGPVLFLNIDVTNQVLNPYLLIVLTLVLSFLLVANLKLMAFKFKGFGWKDNKWKYILLILCLPLVIWLKFASAPIILVLYIIISQIHFRTIKHEI